MITLFISKISFAFITLIALYVLAKIMLAKSMELFFKVRNMTDDELLNHFQNSSEDYEKKATYWKGQECRECFEEITKRQLLRKMPDASLIDKFHHVSNSYEKSHTYWRGNELSNLRKEMKRRHLL